MERRLYLIRHAKSSWKDTRLSDFDRPLNKRGKHDAPFMGTRLSKYHVQPDLIISSPAKRAIKTAKLLAHEINYSKKDIVEDKKIYGADVDGLLEIIRNLDNDKNQVFLIGHNPGLTLLAESLSGLPVQNIPTCGVFCVEFQADTWKDIKEGLGALIFLDFPKKHME